MIIVEGPDAAGKTTMIKLLANMLDLPVHERSANSDGSPTLSTQDSRGGNLTTWAFNDVRTMLDQPISIYDRHCLISEYIYGPIVRNYLDPNFLSPIIHLTIRNLAKYSLVIFCRLPEDAIGHNLFGNDDGSDAFQMDGVRGNWQSLIYAYDAMRMFWPGDCTVYDYTDPRSIGNVVTAARIHIARFNQLKAEEKR